MPGENVGRGIQELNFTLSLARNLEFSVLTNFSLLGKPELLRMA
jgi:hypothetical protein